MDRSSRHNRKAKDPHPQSRYAFHYFVGTILDAEPTPPLGTAPMPIDADMTPEVVRYWKRHNQALHALEGAVRRQLLEELHRIGAPDSRLGDDMPSDVRTLVDGLVRDRQCALLLMHAHQGGSWTPKPRHRAHHRILAAAWFVKRGCKAAAEHLNDGITRASGRPGLEYNHVRRARIGFFAPGSPARHPRWCSAEIALIVNRFRAVDHVYEQALRLPGYRGLRGLALAEALSDAHDLCEVVHRAEGELEKRGRLIHPAALAA